MTRYCARCRMELPEDAPGDRCPRCLLELGLIDDVAGDDAAAPGGPLSSDPGIRPTEAGSSDVRSLSEEPGDRIGRYRLLQQIGEGGCGVVYLAEQEEPVRRHVALKIVKLGMDTRQVVARFEAERQALA